MPWKVVDVVNERMRFFVRLQSGERMTDLCHEFGISRKKHPTWGPRKLKTRLLGEHPGVPFPAESTFADILKRRGLVTPRRGRRTATPTPTNELTQSQAPNDVWAADFKGQFRLGNQAYCYPLTISDDFSRFFLTCEGMEHTRGLQVKDVFSAAFQQHGLPKVIRTDNGPPFASVGLKGLSLLSVWWMHLGIRVERIKPGHPEQNGRHERLHLTLKQETTRPAGANMLQQQERFDRFVEEYNTSRPHDSLGLRCPADIYAPSTRRPEEPLPELVYPMHDMVRRVRHDGWFRFNHHAVYLTKALAGENVGLREVDDKLWLVSFMNLDLGYLDAHSMEFLEERQRSKTSCVSHGDQPRVSPM
jgi:transposase InsO family protein